MPKGGYRQPSNPAPISGPGALSQRTDGGATEGMTQPVQSYTGGNYGTNKATREQQQAQPMAGSPYPSMPAPVSFAQPTQFPDEPDSTGASWDLNTPGIDTSFVRSIQPMQPANLIYKLMQNDPTGRYEAIYNKLNLE